VVHGLWDASDDVKERFAELFDLRATVHPDSSENGYYIGLTANIPLETEGKKKPAYEMVLAPRERSKVRVPPCQCKHSFVMVAAWPAACHLGIP
jgi:hypothetical protein